MRRKVRPRENTQGTDARTRALHVLSRMRRQHLSLGEACRLEHVKASTVLRHVGNAIQHDKPGGRYHAIAGDKFRRDLQIPTAFGPLAIPVYGSKKAKEVSNYLNAIALYLRKGDASRVEQFKGRTVGVRGQKVELITDPAILSALALAGALQFDQLYASFTGGA